MSRTRPEEIRHFWFEEAGPKAWYGPDAALDAEIERRFGADCAAAAAGELGLWQTNAQDCLALLILLDQFPRNIYRDDARAYSADPAARDVAHGAIEKGHDLPLSPVERAFVYLPFMHSENISDQERGLRQILMKIGPGENLLHARAHREVIRRFGRFPHRNDVLGRKSSAAEKVFLRDGGYGAVVREMTP